VNSLSDLFSIARKARVILGKCLLLFFFMRTFLSLLSFYFLSGPLILVN
jgi:hypothetical protein